MAVVPTNLIQGPATLWAADFGATEPADTAVATAVPSPFVDLGATAGGVTWRRAVDWSELEVDQVAETVGRRVTKIRNVLATNLAEGTLENLARANNTDPTDVTSGTGYESLAVVGGEAAMGEPYYQSIVLEGRGAGGKKRRVFLRKSLNVANWEAAFEKGDKTVIPVEFTGHYISGAVRSIHIVDQA